MIAETDAAGENISLSQRLNERTGYQFRNTSILFPDLFMRLGAVHSNQRTIQPSTQFFDTQMLHNVHTVLSGLSIGGLAAVSLVSAQISVDNSKRGKNGPRHFPNTIMIRTSQPSLRM